MTQNLKAACVSISAATEADHVKACAAAGRRAPLLGKFMLELCDWIATSGKPLTEAYGREWMSYSREQWITDKEVWGKKFKPSMATFDRLLKAGKNIGVLETGQWPTAYTGWEAALICAPTEGYLRSTCEALADQLRTKCEAVANQLRNPDLHSSNSNSNLNPTGAPANAGERPDGNKFPEREERNSPNGEEPSAIFPTQETKSPPAPHAHTVQIDAASVTAKHMHAVWAEGCEAHHEYKPLPLTNKTAGQFKLVMSAFHNVGLHPLEGLAIVAKQWWELRDVVERPPVQPNLDFLTKYRAEAASLAPKLIKSAKQDAERDAERAARQRAYEEKRQTLKATPKHIEPKVPATLNDLMLWQDKTSLSPDLKQLLRDVWNDDSGQFTGQESLDEVRGMLADKAQPILPEAEIVPFPSKAA